MSQYQEEVNAKEGLKTLVLLCSSLEKLGSGLDLKEIRKWVQEMGSGVEVRAVPGLCHQPGKIAEAVPGSKSLRLVLGLCSRDYPQIELHANARKAGLDPFGIEVVSLGAYCARVHPRPQATEKAKLLLVAAVAKAGAFPGSNPDSVKPVLMWNQAISRRALFKLPLFRYEPVPFIRPESCAVDEGCGVCAVICPRQALGLSSEGIMALDKTRCSGCGACLSVCPQTAIEMPGVSPQQIDAQIAKLLDTSSLAIYPRAILFVCEKSADALEALAWKGLSYPVEWLPVDVPCVGIVTPAWLLHCVNVGAAAVAAFPCGREDCRFGKREVIEGRVSYCREFLSLLGASPDAARLLDPCDGEQLARALASLPEREKKPREDRFGDIRVFGPRAAAQALLGLAERFAPSSEHSLAHPYSPLGMVEVEQGCTVCEACVQNCPTDALRIERDAEGVALTFDAGLCIGCEACVPVCPEHAVRVEKVANLSRLALGEVTVHRATEVRCEKCGGPVAPAEMLRKITVLLGSDSAVSTVTRYCLSCRGVMLPGEGYCGRISIKAEPSDQSVKGG
ncbi:MAG: 4Fe-4S binding protein [Candidatus Binatia bacterium]